MAKFFAASRRKYQTPDGLKDRTATVTSSGLMINKKEFFIRILMPCIKPGPVGFSLVQIGKTDLGKFPIGLCEPN